MAEKRGFSESGRIPCRFSLFVRLINGIPSPFPHQSRIFTFRGDKHTDVESKMLTYLMNIIRKYHKNYSHMILYDNNNPAGHPLREVFYITKNDLQKHIITKNVLKREYPFAFEKMRWPEWIVTEVNNSNEEEL